MQSVTSVFYVQCVCQVNYSQIINIYVSGPSSFSGEVDLFS